MRARSRPPWISLRPPQRARRARVRLGRSGDSRMHQTPGSAYPIATALRAAKIARPLGRATPLLHAPSG